MNNISKYKIFKDLGIVIQFQKNNLSYKDAEQLKLKIINDSDFSPKFSFLIDVREVTKYQVTKESRDEYRRFVSKNLIAKGVGKIAILTDTPEQVVNATMFSLKQDFDSNRYKIFSALEEAVRWLDIDFGKWDIIFSELNKMNQD